MYWSFACPNLTMDIDEDEDTDHKCAGSAPLWILSLANKKQPKQPKQTENQTKKQTNNQPNKQQTKIKHTDHKCTGGVAPWVFSLARVFTLVTWAQVVNSQRHLVAKGRECCFLDGDDDMDKYLA